MVDAGDRAFHRPRCRSSRTRLRRERPQVPRSNSRRRARRRTAMWFRRPRRAIRSMPRWPGTASSRDSPPAGGAALRGAPAFGQDYGRRVCETAVAEPAVADRAGEHHLCRGKITFALTERPTELGGNAVIGLYATLRPTRRCGAGISGLRTRPTRSCRRQPRSIRCIRPTKRPTGRVRRR